MRSGGAYRAEALFLNEQSWDYGKAHIDEIYFSSTKRFLGLVFGRFA
jgi:hypothetical protein